MKVAFVIGTRPEYIKVFPVYKQLRDNPNFQAVLISTGQHSTMLAELFAFFEVKPDIELDTMVANQSLGKLTAQLHTQLEKCLESVRPDLLFVQGDTTSAFVAALTAFYQKIPVAHLEAGLRTFNIHAPFPEEVNRTMISSIAELNFCPTLEAMGNLEKESRKNCYLVGNSVIDSLHWAINKLAPNEQEMLDYFDKIITRKKELVLITAHRRENHGAGLAEIVAALRTLAQKFQSIDFVIPVHLNPNVSSIIKKQLAHIENVFLLPPLPYDKFVFLMNRSFIIMTDSGGLQEEAPSLNKPVLVLREVTERPEGIAAKTSKLVGTQKERIIEAFEWLLQADNYNAMAEAENPFGNGTTARQVEEILMKQYF